MKQDPTVEHPILEFRLERARPDIFAVIKGVPVAVEIQISSLSAEEITRRTIRYHQLGIYVLWLLQWSPKLDQERYTPKHREKWIHAAYFGRVFYWTHGLNIVSYHFDASLTSVPSQSSYGSNGELRHSRGYTRKSKRFRVPVRGPELHLTRDFEPQERLWWEGGGIKVPDAKLYIARSNRSL